MDFAFATSSENGNRERLAWLILLSSFLVWLGLIIAVPIGVSTFLHNASRPLVLAVQANEGTVGLSTAAGQRDAIFVGEPARTIDDGRASILTSTTDTALVSVFTPEQTEVLSRLQVYANTGLQITQARAPRFEMSNDSYELDLALSSGRLRINLPEPGSRPTVVRVATPQDGEIILDEPGRYSFDVTNAETSVVVLEGRANVSYDESVLSLVANQRALVPAEGALTGPLDSERNLVQNSDFNDEMRSWIALGWEAEQEPGETSLMDVDGDTAIRFHRVAVGPAEAELRQVINQDVTDFTTLELFVTMRVAQQSLGVCGVQGSECPLFVRITYDDIHGAEQVWQQGFFAEGTVGSSTPDICQFCATPRLPHLRVPLNQIYFYESGNLLERMAQQNIAPRFIKSISLVASGHTFDTQVLDVGLIAIE
ncbi:MAG TPA: hypothetical protein VK879_17795 [Candidatus Sulfomarinibacteraceae bacterium]|nr:hypothetical protein [Candidatus Sulfomarinibacteraceae bacterium]